MNRKRGSRSMVTKNMSKVSQPIGKRYNKAGTKCKVTFRLPEEAVPDAQKVNLVGDFNNWSITESPLERLKSGEFKVVIDLVPGREYRFKFLIDGEMWENHWNADKYVINEYGTEDSVVVL